MAGHACTVLEIEAFGNAVHDLDLEGQQIIVRQTCRKVTPGVEQLELIFSLTKQARLSLAVTIPADCLNACVVMNGQMLITWFSDMIPPVLPGIGISVCSENEKPISTLKPGQRQLINFRWQEGDQLSFYWYR